MNTIEKPNISRTISARPFINHAYEDVAPRHTVTIEEGYYIDCFGTDFKAFTTDELDSWFTSPVATVKKNYGVSLQTCKAEETDDRYVFVVLIDDGYFYAEECDNEVIVSKSRMMDILNGDEPTEYEFSNLDAMFERLQYYRRKDGVMIDGEVISYPRERLKAARDGVAWIETSDPGEEVSGQ